jgi:hypothetical protein
MEEQDDPIFNQVVAACTNHHIKEIMSFKFDWNNEAIAQFFATLYVEEVGDARNMHWMTVGDWYSISYDDFAHRLGFGREDQNCPKIHLSQPLDEQEMKFMYAPGVEGNTRHINRLYTFYSVLNCLCRKIICSRDGDPTNISYAKNLLANKRGGALYFSVIDFVWEEIKGISMNPQKNCSFAPYIMFIIEEVTNRDFPKDGFHMPFRPFPTKKPLICPSLISSPPRSNSITQQQQQIEELVKLVMVTRGSLPLDSMGNLLPQSRSCLVYYLTCIALTMPMRQGYMSKERLRRSSKEI